MKVEIDAYEKLGKEADKRHAEKLWVSGHYHFMLEVRESLKEKNGFIHTLARDLVVLQEHEDYYYATLCMNAMPHLIKELRAAREVVELGRQLEPLQPSEVKLGEYLVKGWFDFIKVIEKYDEACSES